jgi:hypothetical protein
VYLTAAAIASHWLAYTARRRFKLDSLVTRLEELAASGSKVFSKDMPSTTVAIAVFLYRMDEVCKRISAQLQKDAKDNRT